MFVFKESLGPTTDLNKNMEAIEIDVGNPQKNLNA